MELESLPHLLALEIEIIDPMMIPKGFKCFSLLRRYKISIGHAWDWNGHNERSKTLKLKVKADVHLEDSIELLLRETEDLYLDGARGTQTIFYEGFPNLKLMHFGNDFVIQHLIKSTMQTSSSAFPVLESLYLNNLQRLEKICGGQLGMGSFGELRILKVGDCDKLKTLFSFTSAKCLQQLQEMEVAYCENIEAIAEEGSEDVHFTDEIIDFSHLGSLKLLWLPHLICFCKIKGGTEHVGLLFNSMVSIPNLTSLEVNGCKSLKHVFSGSIAKCLMQLKKLTIENCELVEEIIQSKKMEEIEEEDCAKTIVFSKLDSLSLGYLPNLKRFNSCYSIEFPLLRQLTVGGCDAMGNFVVRDSSSEREEYFFNEMVTFSNLETLDNLGMDSIKYLWDEQFISNDSFYKLKSIYIVNCSKLSVVFPSKICTRFQRVERLTLSNCGRVEEIYQQLDFKEIKDSFSLRDLRIESLPSLKHIWNKDDEWRSFATFQNLQSVAVAYCKKLKYVFPASVGCSLLQLQQLELLACKLEVMIAKKNHDGGVDASYQFPELRALTMDEQGFLAINRSIDPTVELYSKLKKVTLCFFNEETSLAIIFGFLSGLKSLEMLVFESSSLEEIFMLIGDEQHHRLRVKHLELRFNTKLKHILKKGSQFNHSLQHLQTLNLCVCVDMISIAPSSTSLQNLTILHVDSCNNMTNLVTTSTAKTLVRLMEMKVLNCMVIEEIVAEDEDSTEHDVIAFNKLQHLELTNLPKLNSFCSNKQFLKKLRKITVRDCISIQVVFDLEGLSGAEGLLSEFKELELINLPMLTQLCNKTPKGILDFNKMEVLKIDNCSRLEYPLTWSMASCLSQLQRLEVKSCEMMETLIIDEEDAMANAIFSKSENLVLENMPKFSSFYSGSGDLECASLFKVTTRDCPRIKVFPKMNELSIDMKSIRAIMQFDEPTNLFSNLKRLEVWHCSATSRSHVSLVCFLSRLPNLDQLLVCDSSFKELLNNNTVEVSTMPQIKSLTLDNLDDLNKICWQASLFQSLETLEVGRCGKLVNLASSSASFQNLSTLKLYECNQLMNLITPSMARNMAQLKVLKVSNCKMLMEIVGDGTDETTHEIVFCNLKTLELFRLQSLKAFSLTNYNFKFPCLDKFILRACPNLRIFCHGIINTPMLSSVKDLESYWESDLNTTTKHLYQQMVGFRGAKEIKLSSFPMLKEKWAAQIPINFLYSLERLEVDDCELFSNAIPSHLLQYLESLQVLIVEKCDSIEQVIDLEGLNVNECGGNQMRNLEQLQLIDLARLKKVWSKDPQQILSLKNLQVLKVYNCGSLTYIFDLSMALSLRNLQSVEVKNCRLVEHVIIIAEEETMQKYVTVFPLLQSMTLEHLTNLLSFCSTSGILECSSLKNIEVVDCPTMDLFSSTFSEGQDSSVNFEEKGESVGNENPESVTAFLGNKIVIPGLEELKVEWKTLKDELIGNRQSGLISQLKCIELAGFQDEECAVLPLTSLHQFLKLEKLAVGDALIEEINLDDLSILKDNNPEFLALLNKLKLSKLPNLKRLVSHDCQPIPSFKYLVDLEVVECSSLKVLVPPSGAFHNLTDLEVSNCDGLISLVSVSTARSLVQLRRMNVKDCKMLQEIVAIASDGVEYEIRFSQLEYLGLHDLPSLKSFGSGNYDFHFPSLEEVMVTICPRLKNFTEKVSGTPKLRKVRTGQKDYDWEWEGSLNDTIQALYMERDAEEKAAQNIPQEQIE